MLSRSSDQTLTDQLASRFAERIRSRLLPPGSRLPSVRECARRHAVSPYTVVAAYDQLQAQGLIEARRHRGYFVREPRPEPARARQAAAPSPGPGRSSAPIDAATLIRGMLQRMPHRDGPARNDPGLGVLPCIFTRRLRTGSRSPKRLWVDRSPWLSTGRVSRTVLSCSPNGCRNSKFA